MVGDKTGYLQCEAIWDPLQLITRKHVVGDKKRSFAVKPVDSRSFYFFNLFVKMIFRGLLMSRKMLWSAELRDNEVRLYLSFPF